MHVKVVNWLFEKYLGKIKQPSIVKTDKNWLLKVSALATTGSECDQVHVIVQEVLTGTLEQWYSRNTGIYQHYTMKIQQKD